MPAAVPAAVGLILTAAEVSAGWVLFWTLASSVAVSYAVGDMEETSLDDNGHQVNTRSMNETVPLIYGETRVGINQVYVGVSGNDNKFLHIVGVVGEGPVKGIKEEYGVPQIFLNDTIYTEYGSDFYYEFFTGTETQSVCSTLNAAVGTWNDPLKHTAYIYVRLRYNQNKYQSIPKIELVIEGLKIANPLTGLTEYSNNPAICTYDFLTRPSTRGGMGLSTSRFDLDSLSETMEYCTVKGWTCNIPIIDNQAASDNLQLILNNFRGEVVHWILDDKFKIMYRDLNYEAPVDDLDENDLVSAPRVGGAEGMSRPNAVRVKFLNEVNQYIADDVVVPATDIITDDGDFRENEIKIYGLSTHAKAQEAGYYFLERARWNKSIVLHCKHKHWLKQPMQIIQLSYDNYGWSNKLLRIVSMGFNDDMTVILNCIEEDEFLYDNKYNLTEDIWYDTTLPDPNADVIGVTGASCEEETYYFRGRTFTRLNITFSPPAEEDYPWWDYAEVWIKIDEGGWQYMTTSRASYMLDPVEEGVMYYIRLRSVSIHGNKEDLENAFTFSTEILGKTDAPSDLDGMTAVANGDTVTIYAGAINDPDIESYEVRIGSSWVGGVFISDNKSPSIRMVGVRPGTHTFWMSPVALAGDNTKVYSENPVNATVEVFVPAGYSEDTAISPWSWDYSTGTHQNTEQQTTSPGSVSDPVLKCSHGLDSEATSDGAVGGTTIIDSTLSGYADDYFNGLNVTISDFIQDNGDFTLHDPDSRVTLTDAYTTTVSGLDNDEDVYLCADFGVDHFSGNIGFKFKLTASTINSDASGCVFALTNSQDTLKNIYDAEGDFVALLFWKERGVTRLYLHKTYDDPKGYGAYGDYVDIDLVTSDHYIYIKRDITNGTITAYIYSDSDFETLVAQLSIQEQGTAYRYLHWLNRFYDDKVTVNDASFTVEDYKIVAPETQTITDFDQATTTLTTDAFTYQVKDGTKYVTIGADALTGTWTSPTEDFGSIKTVRVWGDFRTAFSAVGTTWDGVIPLPAFWESIDIENKTFSEIFGTEGHAGQIQATLKYKEAAVDDWTEIDYFEVMCAEITARYVAVEVTLIDPTPDVNLYLYKLNMSAYDW